MDESAVSAIVGSLENQLVTSSSGPAGVIGQNHVNSAISNGGPDVPQKHGTVANGDSISDAKPNNAAAAVFMSQDVAATKSIADSVKIVMPSARVALPAQQALPNGTVQQAAAPPKQPTLAVIKTSGAPNAPGLVTVPMNVSNALPPANNVGSPSTQSPNILSNLQVVNVRPGVPTQQQKGQPARVVLSAPQIVGGRPGAPVSWCTRCKFGRMGGNQTCSLASMRRPLFKFFKISVKWSLYL